MKERPNVLFVLSDQHNAKVLGHKGHPDVKTPALDRLAAEGVRFDNAICQNPICTPSRVSFWSGQYCHNHGYYGLDGPNPGGLPSMLGHFRRAGYVTGAAGKLHLPEYWGTDDCDLRSGKDPYFEHLARKGLKSDPPVGHDGCASTLRYEDSSEGWYARQTVAMLDQAGKTQQPFFLYCGFIHPHSPYVPSEPFWSMYDEQQLALPPNSGYDMELKAPHMRRMAAAFRTGDWTKLEPRTFEAGRRRKLRGYLGNVSQVDHALGQILEALKARGLDENTIVVYSTDHGDYACEHDLMEKAPGICADAITRIPFIWRWPGRFKSGHVAGEIVETVDVSATLCALAGVEPLQTSDGKDISHLLRGEHGAVHEIGVTEFAWSKSVRKGRYRCVYYPKAMFAEAYPGGFGELYDLEADPWEMRNLYFEADCVHLVRELRVDLLDWLVTTTRVKTVLPPRTFSGPQARTRFKHTTNPDGKIHPDRIRGLSGQNYV
ncbi:MAG: sulfatase-like hydrolase/transferase [Kiritimatiellae bacterium]|nr:sulfatase-like hydrolase/transferase [Kiritimatiellia bacterium]